MADDPETKPKSLKERLKEVPSDMEIRMRIMASLGSSDYETAMLCGSLLDAMLRHAILASFAPIGKTHVDNLFSDANNSPLSTYAAKIKIAHALGIISSDTKTQIEHLKSIRNSFAHISESVSFSEPSVIIECDKIRPHRQQKNYEYFEKTLTEIIGKPSGKLRYAYSILSLTGELQHYIWCKATDRQTIPIDCFSNNRKECP